MKLINVSEGVSSQNRDWWSLTLSQIEQLADTLLRPLSGGWARRGQNFVKIGEVKYGADARKLGLEMIALVNETKRILSVSTPEAILRAAAFYHLRFENIHPLCEANGRIGRVILAGQLDQSLRIPMQETLQALKDWEMDYRRVFAAGSAPLMFELLLDLLARITGHVLSPEASQLPASIEPLYPQKGIPANAPRLHPEQAMKNPALIKQFARQQQRQRNAGAFRKYF
jgi:hypothetical protein